MKKKLNLEDLKVESFETSKKQNPKGTVQGNGSSWEPKSCELQHCPHTKNLDRTCETCTIETCPMPC